LVFETIALGFNVVVNQQYIGIIYHSDIITPIHIGVVLNGYVLKIRKNNSLDISLKPTGVQGIVFGTESIMTAISNAKGFIPIHDNSSPEEIASYTGLSKKNFKRALSMLYKNKNVAIEKNDIRLID
jgi:Uncharacterized protein conserved in bacteria